jgi:hypothetical protein
MWVLLGELRDAWRAEPRESRNALILIAVVGLVLRLTTLGQPIRYDESVTYLQFARLPLSQALSHYDYPNNHLFHTLLVKGAVAVFGNAPWALRLPAFLAGLAIIPLSWAVSRTLVGARAALVATALVSASGLLTLYSTNARGYSMMVLAFLILVLIAARLIRAPNRRLWIGFILTAAIGVWTIPVMLYPIGAVALWLALNLLVEGRRGDLPILAASLAAAAVLALLAYAPVFSHAGVGAVVRNQYVAATEWTQFLNDMAGSGWSTIKSWGLGLPPVSSVALFAAAIVGLIRLNRASTFRVGLPLAAFVWSAWLLVATHVAPYPRMWLWCVPVVATLAAVGLLDGLEGSKRLAGIAKRVPLLATVLATGAAASVAVSRAVLLNRDTGTFVEASETARQLKSVLREGDRVIAAIPTSGPLAYYFDRYGIDSLHLKIDEADASRLFVVVNEGERETLDAVVEGATPGDTSHFRMTIIARRPLSTLYLFERRDAPK